MGKILAPKNLEQIESFEEFKQKTSQLLSQLVAIVSGKLTFGENVQGRIVDANFVASSSDTIVSHGLGYTPSGYLVIATSVALTVYGLPNPGWNGDVILLRSSAIGTAKLIVF